MFHALHFEPCTCIVRERFGALEMHFDYYYLNRRLLTVNYLSSSANQNKVINILCKKFRIWRPCFPHKLKHDDGMEDWCIPNKTFQ